MIKILVIEDDQIWQSIIETVLSSYPQFKIIGRVDSVEDALEIIDINKPDIIISDLLFARDNVLFSMEPIFYDFPTLFISSKDDEEYLIWRCPFQLVFFWLSLLIRLVFYLLFLISLNTAII
jgi:response regulator of citrate/malate metabolism